MPSRAPVLRYELDQAACLRGHDRGGDRDLREVPRSAPHWPTRHKETNRGKWPSWRFQARERGEMGHRDACGCVRGARLAATRTRAQTAPQARGLRRQRVLVRQGPTPRSWSRYLRDRNTASEREAAERRVRKKGLWRGKERARSTSPGDSDDRHETQGLEFEKGLRPLKSLPFSALDRQPP